MSAIEVISDAMDKITDVGWIKGETTNEYWDEDSQRYVVTGYCTMGAIMMSDDDNMDFFNEALSAISEAIREEGFVWDPYNSLAFVAQFNDHENTSKEDVLLVMKKAKHNLENEV
jgi:hypothetical protein